MALCQLSELYFSSEITEPDNLSVLGIAYQLKDRKKQIVLGATEHHTVFELVGYKN